MTDRYLNGHHTTGLSHEILPQPWAVLLCVDVFGSARRSLKSWVTGQVLTCTFLELHDTHTDAHAMRMRQGASPDSAWSAHTALCSKLDTTSMHVWLPEQFVVRSSFGTTAHFRGRLTHGVHSNASASRPHMHPNPRGGEVRRVLSITDCGCVTGPGGSMCPS